MAHMKNINFYLSGKILLERPEMDLKEMWRGDMDWLRLCQNTD
jgi:hypothetical protein